MEKSRVAEAEKARMTLESRLRDAERNSSDLERYEETWGGKGKKREKQQLRKELWCREGQRRKGRWKKER